MNKSNNTPSSIDRARTAYANAESPEIKKLLVDLFGEDVKTADNRPVTERIKTFDDACDALGENHPYVVAYNTMNDIDEYAAIDIIAYLKLRIIVAALNEGWIPGFVEDERRWAPWFVLYTNKEIDNMNESDRKRICRVVGRSHDSAYADGGLACAIASYASSSANTGNAARLAFKTEALARYAGTQFIDIYRDFIIAEQ